MPEPFMEHPTGEFDSAIEAMTDAICRLRELPAWDDWITFCAQGIGPRPDSVHFAEICILKDQFDLDIPLDLEAVHQQASVSGSCLSKRGGFYSVASASPAEVARIFDAIFRYHLGIKPHADEGDDYPIGAEWEVAQYYP
ncbi:hypothetical protein OT109_08450 [Phycisphaeraceae bacterium D3-23]